MTFTTQEVLLIQLRTGPQSLGQLVAYAPDPASSEAAIITALDFLVMSSKVVIVSAKVGDMRQHYVFGNIGAKRDLADSIDARGIKVYKLA